MAVLGPGYANNCLQIGFRSTPIHYQVQGKCAAPVPEHHVQFLVSVLIATGARQYHDRARCLGNKCERRPTWTYLSWTIHYYFVNLIGSVIVKYLTIIRRNRVVHGLRANEERSPALAFPELMNDKLDSNGCLFIT